MLRSDFLVVLKNRGIRYRLWRDFLRVQAISKYIAKHFKVSKGLSNVVFLTLTYDPSKYTLVDAWRDLRKRFGRVVRYFKRRYEVVCALGVVEAHESRHPHFHIVILLEKPAPVFLSQKTLGGSQRRRVCGRRL